MAKYKVIPGGACAAKGFSASGVHAGFRANPNKLDLAIIKADVRCAAAGVYTTNKVYGAPIKVDRAHLVDGHAQAVLVNSGNANTCAMGCDCRDYFVVEHNGDVYPCDFFVRPELRLGNILTHDWDELWESPLHTAFGRRKATWNAACNRCPALRFCQGDCPKNRTGHDPARDPRTLSHLCPAWQRIYAHILPPLQRLANEIRDRREGWR